MTRNASKPARQLPARQSPARPASGGSGGFGGKDGGFERQLKRLEEIVEILEQGEVTLDEAVKMYEEGVHISKQCLEKLTQAELKLKRLSKDINGNFELFDEDVKE